MRKEARAFEHSAAVLSAVSRQHVTTAARGESLGIEAEARAGGSCIALRRRRATDRDGVLDAALVVAALDAEEALLAPA